MTSQIGTWTYPCLGRKRSIQSIFKKWRNDIFSLFWKIIFTKKQEKTTCVVDILVLMVFFVVPLAEKLSWYSGMICNGFMYSEKNIRGLGRVLKKRYVGFICGTWNYWVGQSAQGS